VIRSGRRNPTHNAIIGFVPASLQCLLMLRDPRSAQEQRVSSNAGFSLANNSGAIDRVSLDRRFAGHI
jgi:hypothetical protein